MDAQTLRYLKAIQRNVNAAYNHIENSENKLTSSELRALDYLVRAQKLLRKAVKS